jgi:hypothetical protein
MYIIVLKHRKLKTIAFYERYNINNNYELLFDY